MIRASPSVYMLATLQAALLLGAASVCSATAPPTAPTRLRAPPSGCPEVACELYCEHGKIRDDSGCEICTCQEPPTPLTATPPREAVSVTGRVFVQHTMALQPGKTAEAPEVPYEDEQLVVELPDGSFKEIKDHAPEWIDLAEAGTLRLHNTPMLRSNASAGDADADAGALWFAEDATLPAAVAATISVQGPGSASSTSRFTGLRSAIVVRVSTSDVQNPYSTAFLSNVWFGTDDDTVHPKERFAACSHQTLQFEPATPGGGGGARLVETGTCSDPILTLAACSAAGAELGLTNVAAVDDGQANVGYDPLGCYFEQNPNAVAVLKFNNNGNTGACSGPVIGNTGNPNNYDQCICGGSTRRRRTIVDGVIDVTIDTNVADTSRSAAWMLAKAEAIAELGVDPSSYTHAIYCLPNGIPRNAGDAGGPGVPTTNQWFAFATTGGQYSVYNERVRTLARLPVTFDQHPLTPAVVA